MSKKNIRSLVAVTVAMLLVWGIVRAATSRYVQQREATYAQCRAEQKRLGLAEEALETKYPTPEISLCRIIRVVPGGTGEVVAQGNFVGVTKFLFDNDRIEVVKEAPTSSEYRATIKAAQASGPDVGSLEVLQAVSCRHAECLAVYIGGKYEWDLVADNGWRIKLNMLEESFTGREQEIPKAKYCGEFYRGTDPKAFEARALDFRFRGDASYLANIQESGCAEAEAAAAAELQKLTLEMMNPNLSAKEREALQERLEKLAGEMQQAMVKAMGQEGQAEREKKREEFGCGTITLSLKGTSVEGVMECGQAVGRRGRLALKGTMKYLGP